MKKKLGIILLSLVAGAAIVTLSLEDWIEIIVGSAIGCVIIGLITD